MPLLSQLTQNRGESPASPVLEKSPCAGRCGHFCLNFLLQISFTGFMARA